MTIDTGWTKIIKKNVPHAFSAKISSQPTTVFIDGQIKLMCGQHIKSWSQLVRQQFLACIEAGFKTGACIVVLAFDNYDHVPESKNMTQAKRSKQHACMQFDDSDLLPPCMPDNWYAAMRNRCFKTKVMYMIVNTIRQHFMSSDVLQRQGRTVILDFVDVEVLGANIDVPTCLSDQNSKRGECDIKAFRWSCYGPLLIFSTDGDYLMIALMQLERLQQSQATADDCGFLAPAELQTELRVKPKQRPLQQQEYIGDADGDTWRAQIPQHTQRFYLWRMTTNVDTTLKRKKSDSSNIKYEYVDIQAILVWLQTEMAQMRCVGLASDNLAALVAATGCDFCMSLPNVGPERIWKQRHRFKHLNLTSPLDLMQALSCVYEAMYRSKLPGTVTAMQTLLHENEITAQTTDKHEAFYEHFAQVSGFTDRLQKMAEAYAMLARNLHNNAQISETIKKRTWSVERMQAHVLNAIWTTRYWMYLDKYPDPLTGYGFVKTGNRVMFEAAV